MFRVRASHGEVCRAVAALVAQRPGDDARVVLVALAHADAAVHDGIEPAPRRLLKMVSTKLCALACSNLVVYASVITPEKQERDATLLLRVAAAGLRTLRSGKPKAYPCTVLLTRLPSVT